MMDGHVMKQHKLKNLAITRNSGEKRMRGRLRKTKYLSGVTKWHGKREASELMANTDDRTRWISMVANTFRHPTNKIIR